jgi:hypothetical protein
MSENQSSCSDNKSQPQIILQRQKLFSSGFYRDTYIHPYDAKKILKIARRQTDQTRKGVLGLQRRKANDPNQLELNMWQELEAKGHDKSGYFSRVYGWIDTDIGRALCVERLNSDANFPPLFLKSLDLHKAQGLNQEIKHFIQSSIDEFFEYVIMHSIFSCAWRLENIAICRQNGKLVLKTFDTKAITIKEWIPISKYFQSMQRRKIRRRTNKLRDHLKSIL